MIQQGAFKLRDVDFNPLQVLEFIRQTFALKARSKDIEIRTHFVDSLPAEIESEHSDDLDESSSIEDDYQG